MGQREVLTVHAFFRPVMTVSDDIGCSNCPCSWHTANQHERTHRTGKNQSASLPRPDSNNNNNNNEDDDDDDDDDNNTRIYIAPFP